jgi:TRAP-type C4-dicarboxylate transport system substrate-binding protein
VIKLPVYSRADLSRTGALVVALFLTAVSTSAVSREFRVADTQNEDYPTVQALRYMGNLIAEQSGGRHQIRVFHSHQLGEEKQTIEPIDAGAIDLNRSNGALIGTFVPAMNGLAMPFLFRSIEHLQKVLDVPIGNAILNRFEPYGFAGLAAGVTIVTDFDRKPFEAAMAGIYAKAERDPATAELIERIRKVE